MVTIRSIPAFFSTASQSKLDRSALGMIAPGLVASMNGAVLDEEDEDDKTLVGYFVFVRHVHSQANQQHALGGADDTLPSDEGILQGQSVGYKILSFAKEVNGFIKFVVTSPLTRARFTAESIASVFGVQTYKANPIREINWGKDANGVPMSEVERRYGHDYMLRVMTVFTADVKPFNGGENQYELAKRVNPYFFTQILTPFQFFPYQPFKRVPISVLVSHSNVFKVLLRGMIRNGKLRNLHLDDYQLGRVLAKNADPMIFKVMWSPVYGLTLSVTPETEAKIKKAIEDNKL